MKIEKISDTQIRCTLSRQDLADRDLKISELAYGSDKAKDLFRELMVQASYECGFEEGYAMAMKESKHAYKEHDYNERGSYGYGERRGRY